MSRQLDHDDVDVPRIGPVARAALERLRHKLTTCADVSCGQDYPGPWHGIVHGDLHGGNIMVDSRSCAAQLNSLHNSARLLPAALTVPLLLQVTPPMHSN